MNTNLIPVVDAAPLPGPAWLFQVLLVFTFFLHLLFMNLTLGGTLIAAVAHRSARGRVDDHRSALARRLVAINTYGISLTITTGVAPLLFVQVLYQQYFYTATILIGMVWLTMLLLLMLAYYAVYAYKFGAVVDGRETRGGWLAASATLFVVIAMIQVAVHLIHAQPDKWASLYESGWSILGDPTYLARLLHFLLAALGSSALVCVWWALRQAGRGIERERNEEIARYAWRWVVWTTVLQVVDGFVLLFLLPAPVLVAFMNGGIPAVGTLLVGVLLAIGLVVMVARVGDPSTSPAIVAGLLAAMTLTIAVMAILRDQVRAFYLQPFTSQFEFAPQPQWANFLLFAVTLVAGLAVVAWMVRRVLGSPASGAEAA